MPETAGETWDLPRIRQAAEIISAQTRIGENLVAVASLVIRQDMALADAVTPNDWTRAGDPQILDWAVDTAGHLFDQHELWDCGLLTDAQHIHRCVSHRHAGPGTQYPAIVGIR